MCNVVQNASLPVPAWMRDAVEAGHDFGSRRCSRSAVEASLNINNQQEAFKRMARVNRASATTIEVKTEAAAQPIVQPVVPTLDEVTVQAQDVYRGVMSGELQPDKARVALQAIKQTSKRFDLGIQLARMMPSYRPSLAQILGLPEPKQPAVAAK